MDEDKNITRTVNDDKIIFHINKYGSVFRFRLDGTRNATPAQDVIIDKVQQTITISAYGLFSRARVIPFSKILKVQPSFVNWAMVRIKIKGKLFDASALSRTYWSPVVMSQYISVCEEITTILSLPYDKAKYEAEAQSKAEYLSGKNTSKSLPIVFVIVIMIIVLFVIYSIITRYWLLH